MDPSFILIAALILGAALIVNRWLRQLSVMSNSQPTYNWLQCSAL